MMSFTGRLGVVISAVKNGLIYTLAWTSANKNASSSLLPTTAILWHDSHQ